MLVEDLVKFKKKIMLECKLLEKGVCFLIIVILVDLEENVIGLVELVFFNFYGLYSFIEFKFKEIVGFFCIVVCCSWEEVDNVIEVIVWE